MVTATSAKSNYNNALILRNGGRRSTDLAAAGDAATIIIGSNKGTRQ